VKAKEILMQYRYKLQKVDHTLEEYQMYKTRAEKMTSIISDTASRTNTASDKVGDYASIMADLSKEYERRWIEAEQERLRIIDTINALDEPYSRVLFLRYVRCYDFIKTADEIGYSLDHTNHLHGIALQKYERRYTNNG
jgi:DNA-directed RNA polymerase specialized sigma24 family protein